MTDRVTVEVRAMVLLVLTALEPRTIPIIQRTYTVAGTDAEEVHMALAEWLAKQMDDLAPAEPPPPDLGL